MGRDAHKASFDALTLAHCDAVVLPVSVEKAFEVSIGVDVEDVKKAILLYGEKVFLLFFIHNCYCLKQ
jgi:hypothetical protein